MKKKKIFIYFIIIIIIVFFLYLILFSSLFSSSYTDYYNTSTKTIYCELIFFCFHEIGHALDYWDFPYSLPISQTSEYQSAVNLYLEECGFSDFCVEAQSFPGLLNNPRHSYPFFWGGYLEFYAHTLGYFYEYTDQLPSSLQKFYDINKLNFILETCPNMFQENICDLP